MLTRVLAVEAAILGSELTVLDLFVTDLFLRIVQAPSPPADRPTRKALRTQQLIFYMDFCT